MDDDIEFEFQGGGECELCQSMGGTVSSYPIEPLHPNCACSSEPRCNNRFSFSGGARHYGPNGSCFVFDADITVTCWDGTEIGESREIDMGCESKGTDLADVAGAIEEFAAALADGCPDCQPPAVS